MITIVQTVRVWDTVGEDQTLKGEYKVISGRVSVLAYFGSEDILTHASTEMTSNGMVKVNASSQLEMGETSMLTITNLYSKDLTSPGPPDSGMLSCLILVLQRERSSGIPRFVEVYSSTRTRHQQ